MIRLVQIALLLAIAPFGAGQAQTPVEAVKSISDEWRKCVEAQASLAPVDQDKWVSPAQSAFEYCAPEEQLLIAAINLAASDSGARQAIFAHHRNKVALKKKITDDFFNAVLKQIQKQ